MSGSVITFYSYKGGVGRSFALANIGVLLARWGFRVLCIDFDLEAPGLAHFFGSMEQEPDTRDWLRRAPGLVELVTDFKKDSASPLAWRDHVRRLEHPALGGVSPAGRSRATFAVPKQGLTASTSVPRSSPSTPISCVSWPVRTIRSIVSSVRFSANSSSATSGPS